jgi:hypothetical protein
MIHMHPSLGLELVNEHRRELRREVLKASRGR